MDVTQTIEAFGRLKGKDFISAEKKALKSAGKIFVKEGQKQMKQEVKNVTVQNPKYNDKLISALRYSTKMDAANEQVLLTYHTMGTRKPGSGTFRAKWISAGTKDRETKSGKSTGKIEQGKYNYFKNSTATAKEHALNTLRTKFLDNLNKIWEKKYKE